MYIKVIKLKVWTHNIHEGRTPRWSVLKHKVWLNWRSVITVQCKKQVQIKLQKEYNMEWRSAHHNIRTHNIHEGMTPRWSMLKHNNPETLVHSQHPCPNSNYNTLVYNPSYATTYRRTCDPRRLRHCTPRRSTMGPLQPPLRWWNALTCLKHKGSQ